jgi:acyl carrier protein
MAITPDPKLAKEVKELIVDVCNLSSIDISADDITDDEPLVGPGSQLELDSLDVTEIIVAIEKKYGIRVGSMNLSREIIQSTTALVTFIQEKLAEKSEVADVKAS